MLWIVFKYVDLFKPLHSLETLCGSIVMKQECSVIVRWRVSIPFRFCY